MYIHISVTGNIHFSFALSANYMDAFATALSINLNVELVSCDICKFIDILLNTNVLSCQIQNTAFCIDNNIFFYIDSRFVFIYNIDIGIFLEQISTIFLTYTAENIFQIFIFVTSNSLAKVNNIVIVSRFINTLTCCCVKFHITDFLCCTRSS